MAASVPVWRVSYLNEMGLRSTKFVGADSPDGAVGQVCDASRVLKVQKTGYVTAGDSKKDR